MGSRGGGRFGGRGRFGGGGGFRHAKQEPFILFPEIKLTPIEKDKLDKGKDLVYLRNKLQREITQLPYFLEETFAKDEVKDDIEKYSNVKKRKGTSQASLENSGYMMLQPGYFPLELVRGTKRRIGRKVQWNPKRDQNKLDHLEDLEHKFKDDDSKKEDEEEDEEEEDVEEEPEVDSSDDDYRPARECSDDEDEYNQREEEDEVIL